MTAHTTLHHDTPLAGMGTGRSDLWCSYAAVRTLRWLGLRPENADGARTYLTTRQNADGGFAWDRGMPADAWATYYSTQTLLDLGFDLPRREGVKRWIDATWNGDAYSMTPGQAPDAWATYYGTRTVVQALDSSPPDVPALLSWLHDLQTTEGGLGWSPQTAASGIADIRACYYGIITYRTVLDAAGTDLGLPWDRDRLTGWMHRQQRPSGGFAFSPAAEIPCMWATYRATAALAALGTEPADREACAAWIYARRGLTGAFVRWEGYPVEDVWAAFCAIGALRSLNLPLDPLRDDVARAVERFRCGDGGFTYREPDHAWDVLSTSAELLSGPPASDDADRMRRWRVAANCPTRAVSCTCLRAVRRSAAHCGRSKRCITPADSPSATTDAAGS